LQDTTPGGGGRLLSPSVFSGLPSAWSPAGEHFERRIILRAQSLAWGVEADGLEAVWFSSRARAERHACRLLYALTSVGFDVRMEARDGAGERLAEARCEAVCRAGPTADAVIN
jgi:hypothetical protein